MQHRLAAERRQIQDRQAPVPESKSCLTQSNETDSTVVGSAMNKARHAEGNAFPDPRLKFVKNANDSAHFQAPCDFSAMAALEKSHSSDDIPDSL
jgi:hypothetical protein